MSKYFHILYYYSIIYYDKLLYAYQYPFVTSLLRRSLTTERQNRCVHISELSTHLYDKVWYCMEYILLLIIIMIIYKIYYYSTATNNGLAIGYFVSRNVSAISKCLQRDIAICSDFDDGYWSIVHCGAQPSVCRQLQRSHDQIAYDIAMAD